MSGVCRVVAPTFATTRACGYGSRLALASARLAGTTKWRSRRRTLRGELRGLVLGGERVDQLAQAFARDHLRQLVEGQVDAMVGDAALREIIGADALAPVAG